MKAALAFLACLLLVGCGATGGGVMLYGNSDPEAGRLLFPAAPEVPRYIYAGELTGEKNFSNPAKRGLGGALEYLLGITAGPVEIVELQRPQAVTVDEAGRIYVTDVSRAAVFVFDEAAAELHVWEHADGLTHFVSPVGIALGRDGEILVADSELGLVARLGPDGKPRESFGKGLFKRPTGLARDAKRGIVYVADTHAHDIKVFDDSGRLLEVLGQRGDREGEFNFPTHLAFRNDCLYVTDTMNARVQVFSRDESVERTLGKRGMYVGNLVRPKGVGVDDEGNIYVVESLYDQLLVYNAEGQFLLAIGGSGKEAGRFYLPAGVWVDKRNRVLVADMFNGRVVLFQFMGDLK